MDENRVGDRHPVVREYGTTSGFAPDTGSTRRVGWFPVSDFYLRTKSRKANALFDFLRSHYAEILYLAGDMVDGWNSGRYWVWGPAQNAAARRIFNWGWRNARIVFLPGNHDRPVRFKFDLRSLRTYLKRILSKAGSCLTAARFDEARL